MNTTIKLMMTGKENLLTAFHLATQIFKKIEGYKIINNTMILYWCEKGKDIVKFPYQMNSEQINEFVWGWLQNVEPNTPEPHTDGSTGKAWEFNACEWGLVDNEDYEFITITPIWFVYGK